MDTDDKKVGWFAVLVLIYALISYIPLYFLYQWVASLWWERWDWWTQFYHQDTSMIVGLVTFLLMPAILGSIAALITVKIWKVPLTKYLSR